MLGGLGGCFNPAMDACLGNGMGQGVLGGFGLGLFHRVVRPKRPVSFLGALGDSFFFGQFTGLCTKGKTLTDFKLGNGCFGAFRVLIAQSTSQETAWDHERSWKIARGRGRSVSHRLLGC